jgi:hypothetical protein
MLANSRDVVKVGRGGGGGGRSTIVIHSSMS